MKIHVEPEILRLLMGHPALRTHDDDGIQKLIPSSFVSRKFVGKDDYFLKTTGNDY